MLAIRLNGANELGLPAEWPREVRELREGERVPDGWVGMSKEEYLAYLGANRRRYDEFKALKDLEIWRAERIIAINKEVVDFIETHYNQRQQITLNALFTESVFMNYVERSRYINDALSWVKTVILSYYDARNLCLASTTIDELNKISINYTELNSSDPRITVEVAMSMLS